MKQPIVIDNTVVPFELEYSRYNVKRSFMRNTIKSLPIKTIIIKLSFILPFSGWGSTYLINKDPNPFQACFTPCGLSHKPVLAI